jgi:anti-sigma factor RsiW
VINHEEQLKLQAWLDGELPEPEARDVAAQVAQDKEATELMAELRQTRQALKNGEPVVSLPESREFYWSKIQRQIQSEQLATARKPETPGLALWLRRLLIPLTGAAVFAITALVVTQNAGPETAVIETSLADSGAMVYHDYSAGATFVWFSYPADNEIAEADDMDTFE